MVTKAQLTFQHFFLGIFAVANNFPALGPFLNICDGLNRREQLRLCYIATLTSFIVMIVALVIGRGLLDFLGISIPAFRIAGGLLLCTSGISMLNSKAEEDSPHSKGDYSQVISQAVIPVAIPLTTGAGTFSTIVIFAQEVNGNWFQLSLLLASIVAATIVIYVMFKYSTNLLKVLGRIGMNVLIKIVGLFTLSLGVQFIILGITAAFPAFSNF